MVVSGIAMDCRLSWSGAGRSCRTGRRRMRVVVVEIVDFQPPRSSFSGIPAIRRRTTMNIRFRSVSTALAVLLAMAGTATAATVHYDIDPAHTFPSFEADPLAGLSVCRGKVNRRSGGLARDRAVGRGPGGGEVGAARPRVGR